jgi:hypothetical protein
LRDLAHVEGVDIRFVANRFSETRKFDDKGQKIFSFWDIYPHADLITYPSVYEGFGNAFLEAIYFRKPILVNRYSVYMLDIEPLGFETVTMDGYISDDVVEKVRHVLNDPELRKQMADRNFAIAKQHFSLAVLRRRSPQPPRNRQSHAPGGILGRGAEISPRWHEEQEGLATDERRRARRQRLTFNAADGSDKKTD